MSNMKKDLKSINLQELTEYFKELSQKPYRAAQVYEWIHKKCVSSFDEMTNLSKNLRNSLDENCSIKLMDIKLKQVSKKDSTTKYLMELEDGNTIESVWMQYKHGNSVCISSQVGCRMGCKFCASTTGGLVRSLTTGEMLDQIYTIQRDTNARVSNVIIMGIGEPLDNYDNVVKFIRMLSDENGLNISERNITLSTCGIVENIERLAKEDLSITLAISLHASNDTLRKKIMPVAYTYSIHQIMESCKNYTLTTGRRITFEYTLIQGENDTKECADELIKLIRGMNAHINLIPLNHVNGRFGERSRTESIQSFKFLLEKNHINVTIRREMGSDIDAACGQLRNKEKGGETT